MIRRTDDYSLFSNKELSKIASAVKKAESKQLYEVLSDIEIDKAKITVKELQIQGYHAEMFRVANRIEIYVIAPEKVSLVEAEKSGAFKKLAFGRYSFERNSSLEMHSYPFDDGSIWRIALDSDGKPILVKEVDDEDEDNYSRQTKTAGLSKKAAIVDLSNYHNAVQLLFVNVTSLNQSGNEFLNALFEGPLKNQVIEQLNLQIESYVDGLIMQFQTTEEKSAEVKDLITDGINSSTFATLNDISSYVNAYFTGYAEEDQTEQQQF